MLRLTPFVLFDGNCAEAMTFYTACFGGELVLTRLGETPMKAHFPEAMHGKITHAHLKSGYVEFNATDWLHPTQVPKLGNMNAMFVSSTDHNEVRAVFDKLAVGAGPERFVPLQEMPFGLYGRLTDQFGVGWFFRGDRAEA